MTKSGRLPRTPRRRFPEFRDEAGWEETILARVLTEHGERSDGSSEVHSVSVHKGVINQVEHLGRSFAAADRSNYNLAKPHDIIYTKSPTGDFPFGVVKQNRLPHNVIVSPLYGVFSPTNRHLGYILDAYFESPIRANNYLAPITQKGAKNTIQISNTTFLSKGLYLPSTEAEQRRIASCLSSLDVLIGAEGRKLDALKAHKRGLMQQLLPREGETRPRLRLPEFQDAPGWKDRFLGSMGQFVRGLTYSSGDVAPDGLLVLRSTNIQDGGLVLDRDLVFVSKACPDALRLEQGDIVICMSNGSKALVGKSAEYAGHYSGDITVGAFCSFFRPTLPFAKLAFQTDEYHCYVADLVAGGSINNLNNSVLEQFGFTVPESPAEQHKIAACLSSLDDLIAAQSDKLEALKTLKKGLMQQLFPSLEDNP